MPIKLNLLAEQQAAEEQKRRDPVKRGILAGSSVVALVLLWVGFQQAKLWARSNELAALQSSWQQLEPEHERVTQSLRETMEIEQKLGSLLNLSTNRHLWGSVLNAFQYVIVEDVQVVGVRSEQTYQITEAKPEIDLGNGRTSPAKPASSTEKIKLTVEAKIFGDKPIVQGNLFKEAIAKSEYFQKHITNANNIRWMGMSPKSVDPLNSNRQFSVLTVQCDFPERTR